MAKSRTYELTSGVTGARARPSMGAGDVALSGLGLLTLGTMLAALYMALVYAPTEATQGDAQRIFYFHVPQAWVGFLAFFVVFVASIWYLVRPSDGVDALARAAAEVGLFFTTLMLITGSIWGKAVWGTWWTWSPQLTTSLILWFIYLGYLMLRAYAPTRQHGARYAAVLGIVGFIDVPIVYLAGKWMRDIHPDKVIDTNSASMPSSMLAAFGVSLLAYTLLFAYMLWQRVRIQRLQERTEELGDYTFGGEIRG